MSDVVYPFSLSLAGLIAERRRMVELGWQDWEIADALRPEVTVKPTKNYRRPTRRGPLSAETNPTERAQRQRTVERRLREHRNYRDRNFGTCPKCGGVDPMVASAPELVCRCGASEEEWQAAVWSAAAGSRRPR